MFLFLFALHEICITEKEKLFSGIGRVEDVYVLEKLKFVEFGKETGKFLEVIGNVFVN